MNAAFSKLRFERMAFVTTWIFLGCLKPEMTSAQDPSFSQFFSSPLNINPSLTGIIHSQWRAISNMRTQWSGPISPYQTATVCVDAKLLEDRFVDNSMFGVGLMAMTDRVMNGAIMGNYASGNATFNLKVAESYNATEHRIGAGIGGIYGHKRVDYTKLNFSEQFNGRTFDRNLPSGERSLSQMKPYFSVSAGILYSQIGDYHNLDIGYAQFHSNAPKQSFLEDPNQILPIRHTAYASFELITGEYSILNINTIYQRQGSTEYFSVGGALARFLDENDEMLINLGLWYWSRNALVPYVGMTYGRVQVGLSYDVTMSKLASARRHPNTFELSVVFRGERRNDKGIMYCPWK